jgi:hypothetical protein
MQDGMYHFIVYILDLFLWDGELLGKENLPAHGPAVFIANHLEATGPIAVACSIPMRLYSWSVVDMLDEEKAAAWLKWDFVERTLKLKPPASLWVAKWLSKITVPFLRSLGCIPVFRGDYEKMQVTLGMSMQVLRQGKFLLIFPEDNRLPLDPVTKMQPFQHSFVRLAELYYTETEKCLEFYPVTIHPTKYGMVGKPAVFNPFNPIALERRRLKNMMEDRIVAMYMQLEEEQVPGVTDLQHYQGPTGEMS